MCLIRLIMYAFAKIIPFCIFVKISGFWHEYQAIKVNYAIMTLLWQFLGLGVP